MTSSNRNAPVTIGTLCARVVSPANDADAAACSRESHEAALAALPDVAALPVEVRRGMWKRLASTSARVCEGSWWDCAADANARARWGVDRAIEYLEAKGYLRASQVLADWAVEAAGYPEA